jgi:RNA polymerase sigma factor (sigma-70 family)
MTVSEYNRCVDVYADNLYRFIYQSCKDEYRAQDVVQDTFEKMWLKRSEIDAEKAKSYMFTTAYRGMIDIIRRNKKQGNFSEVNEKKLQDFSTYNDLQEVLHQAIDKLPEDQKSVLLLRDYEGYSYEEIADITGLNESQVKVYIFRARKFLKTYLVSIDSLI